MTQAANPTPTPKYFTLKDCLDYDDGTDIWYELVNGELVEMPSARDINGLIDVGSRVV